MNLCRILYLGWCTVGVVRAGVGNSWGGAHWRVVHTGGGAQWGWCTHCGWCTLGVVHTGSGAHWEWWGPRVVEGSRRGEGGPGGSRWVELG